MARPPRTPAAKDLPGLRARLVDWYRRTARDLPWRRTRDPYAIWVSEVMLQQTRVGTVIPYYERFLTRWPTVEALAEAPEPEVLAEWSGLGYYRRARLMLETARAVVGEHDGRFPRTPEALGELPGFGRYTAGAVASFAFGDPAPAVDGNAARVLARLDGVDADVVTGPGNRRVWALAGKLSDTANAGEVNQALMELGALVCTPRPRCLDCPVSPWCRAFHEGAPERYPGPRRRPKKRTMEVTGLVLERDGAVLLERRSRGLFGGMLSIPMLEGLLDPADAIAGALARYSAKLESVEVMREIERALTHRTIRMRVVRAMAPEGGAAPLVEVKLAELERHAIPSVTLSALRAGLPGARLSARARSPG